MALFNNDGCVIEDSIGTTVKVNDGFSYWGDGDGTYYTNAVIWTGTEFKTISGESVWNAYGGCKYKHLNVVDACEEVLTLYKEKLATEKRNQERESYNYHVYDVVEGNYAYVMKGKRGRKNEGRHGVIIKTGSGAWGPWILIKDEAGETFVVNYDYVAVIPDWEEAWVDNTVEA